MSSESTLPLPAPVTDARRHISLDVLRGVALLGILPMNIPTFAMSHYAFMYPPLNGGLEGVNYWTWLFGFIFIDQKMMSIFSMLFGAGLFLMADRIEQRGAHASPGVIFYRRAGWLLIIGLIHAHFLWYGDILVAYALCGMIIYPLRKQPSRRLLIIAAVLLLIPSLMNFGLGGAMRYLQSEAQNVQSAIEPGVEPTKAQQEILDAWNEMHTDFYPTPKAMQTERNAMLGSYFDYLPENSKEAVMLQTVVFFLWAIWRVSALMLIGIVLLRCGFFIAECSSRFYAASAAIGFAIGIPLVSVGAWLRTIHHHDIISLFLTDGHFAHFASIALAIAYSALIMLAVQAARAPRAQAALAAVGKMALTNYLGQSLICALIFYGWGFGYWGAVSRTEQWLVVLTIWAFQICFSIWWLRAFRFGPAEWLWRSLTYWRLQPLSRTE